MSVDPVQQQPNDLSRDGAEKTLPTSRGRSGYGAEGPTRPGGGWVAGGRESVKRKGWCEGVGAGTAEELLFVSFLGR